MHQEITLSSIVKTCSTFTYAGLAMTLSNPFDLVRIRMQTMPEMIELGLLRSSYSGIIDCTQRVLKEEGFTALFKGNGANLLRFYSSETMNFISKETFQQRLNKQPLLRKNKLFKNFISGALGSWLTLSLLYPIEYARNILARNTTCQKKTITGCLIETAKKRGVLELYRGSLISFAGVAIFRGTYFGIFDTFKQKNQGNLQRWGLAYISSLFAILFTYPSDTIRRRLMCSSQCPNLSLKYSGFLDCSSKIYSREGFKSFYRGGPIIFFQSLSASLILFSYDRLSKEMKVYA